MANVLDRPATRQDLFDRLAALGIASNTIEHDPVFTVAESDEAELALDGAPTKNLFLKDAKGKLYLVVAHAHTNVDLKGLPKVIASARLSFGNAGLLMETLGVTPGSVTAFAVINDAQAKVRVILDHNLMQFERINAHPLENTATTSVARDDLLRFIRATGHDPCVAVLDARSATQGLD